MDEFFARNRLSAYLDGELPSAEAREVEDALARSPELRAELEALRGAIALLRSGGRVPAPRGFARRLERRLEREPNVLGWRRHLRGVRIEAVMLAAAAALVLVYAAKKPVVPGPPPDGAGAVAVSDTTPGSGVPPEPGAPAKDAPRIDAAGVPGAATTDLGASPASPDGAPGEAKPPRPRAQAKEGARPPDSALKKAFAPKGSAGSTIEKEPYTPAWEQQSGDAPEMPSVYSPAPFQYKLRPSSETGLRELAALAASLGGSLADAKGRPLAPYPMESGETRTVRLLLPSVNAGAVAARLTELGQLEVVNTADHTLYASGATVPVVIEVTEP